jgi:hypothetical protein
MDAPLALYVVATIALLTEAQIKNEVQLLIPAAVFIGVAPSIKQEGSVMAAIMAVYWLFLVITRATTRSERTLLLVALASALVPFLLWKAVIAVAGTRGELIADGGISRAFQRFRSGEFDIIRRALWNAVSKPVALLLLVAYVRKHLHFGVAWFFLCYTSALGMVYLMTPYDLNWQIGTSLQRVTLVLSLLASVFAVLELDRWIEHQPDGGREGQPAVHGAVSI